MVYYQIWTLEFRSTDHDSRFLFLGYHGTTLDLNPLLEIHSTDCGMIPPGDKQLEDLLITTLCFFFPLWHMLHPHMDELERPTSLYVSGLGPGDRFRIEVKVSQKWLEFSVNSSIISHIPIISPLYPHDSISLIHIIILILDPINPTWNIPPVYVSHYNHMNYVPWKINILWHIGYYDNRW